MNLLPKLNNLRLQTWPTSIEFIVNLWNNYNNVFINQTANVGLPVDDIEFKKLGPWGDRDRWGEVDSAGSGLGPVTGFCEHGDEPSGFIKKGYFLIS